MKKQPLNLKFKKYHKKRYFKGINYCANNLKFGYYGLKALSAGLIYYNQIEAGRKAINQILKRFGKIWIRIFTSLPLTKKPIETRMGKGKGNIDRWVCYVKPGTILYEINTDNFLKAKTALKNASIKLPIKTKMVIKVI